MISELKPYLKYKDSGLPWLGRIPAHWMVRRNARIFKQRNETGFPNLPILEVSLRTGVRIRNFENSKRKQVMSNREKYKRAAKNDIAYNMMRMWQGAVGVVPEDGLVSPAYVVARPFQETESRYYSYLFRTASYMNEVNKYSHGIVTDRNRLYWDEFKQMPSAFPSTEEQRKIADFLDYHNFIVSRFIRAKRRFIELLCEQTQAIILRTVTCGLDHNVRLKSSGIEWLGEVPDHWRIEPAFVYFKEQFTQNIDNFVTNVLSLSYGKIIPRNVETNFGLLPASFETYQIVEPGNIIMRLTDLQNDQKSLRVGLSSHRGIITSAYLCLRINEGIMPEYAYNLLHSYDLTKVFYSMGGGCRQSIGYDDIKRLPILIPPLSEQAEICRRIDSDIQLIDFLTESTHQKIDFIREYRTRLISDVVTGKLDVRGVTLPAAEEAEVPDESNGTLEPETDVIEDMELEVAQEEGD